MDKITLIGHYGDKRVLKQTSKGWKLTGNIVYVRVGFQKNGAINFIDPDGGPIVRVGEVLVSDSGKTYTIESITQDNGSPHIFNLKEML